MRTQLREFSNYASDAFNSCGRAIQSVICFLLSALVFGLELILWGLRAVRDWVESGCKLKGWMFPSRPDFYTPLYKDNP